MWDIYYALFFLGIAMVILCMLEPAILHKKKEGAEEENLAGHYGYDSEFDDEEEDEILQERAIKARREENTML